MDPNTRAAEVESLEQLYRSSHGDPLDARLRNPLAPGTTDRPELVAGVIIILAVLGAFAFLVSRFLA